MHRTARQWCLTEFDHPHGVFDRGLTTTMQCLAGPLAPPHMSDEMVVD